MTRCPDSRSWFAAPILLVSLILAWPSITNADCPGIPALCGMTCSLDAFGTPIYCSNGQCSCAPGYDTQSAPGGGLVCQPIQPEPIGTESDEYSCPGRCPAAIPWAAVGSIYSAFDFVPVHGIAPGGEAFMPVWGYQATQCGNHGVGPRCQGGTKDGANCNTSADCPSGFCLIGTCLGGSNDGKTCTSTTGCPGGICDPFGTCSNDGRTCSDNSDCGGGICNPTRTWAGCAPDPFPFCYGIQDSSRDWDFKTCDLNSGCGDNCDSVECINTPTGTQCVPLCELLKAPDSAPPGTVNACNYCNACTADFTSAWPFLDGSLTCTLGASVGIDAKTVDPARIDFPNNVSVYRAPMRWEAFSDSIIDDDYTADLESPGHELFDTDTQFPYHAHAICPDATRGRVHVEWSSGESVNHFTDDDWGAANQWWKFLREAVDYSNFIDPCHVLGTCDSDTGLGKLGDNYVRCFWKAYVNPGLTCPSSEDVDADCSLHDPMTVVVGVPSIDCADDPYHGTDEIHPALAVAVRIQEDPSQPEQWAFFYRQHGDTGPCGNNTYSRCLSDFKLPLGLPVVAGNGVLTGADVHVDWHPWADKTFGDPSPDIMVERSTTSPVAGQFDLTNGTVVNIHLPHQEDGVVGLVTITPTFDSTPPQITCPGNVNKPPDLGTCTAVATFAPTVSDNCSASATCNPPSGSAFPIGTTNVSCTATDQAGLSSAPCNFNVTVTAGNKCPHDQGYWKNHPNLWPVNSLKLGTVPYSKTQLLSILNNSTTGDASVILAKAEIATLLNLANGSNPTPICGTIADANGALGGSTVPAKVSPKTVLGQRMVSAGNTLNSYNSGNLTPGCTP